MSNNKKLKELLQELANDPSQEVYSIVATVVSVDQAANTVDVQPANGDPELFNIQLTASQGAGNFVVVPVVGSSVIVTFTSNTTGYVSAYTEVAGYKIDTQLESLEGILSDILDAITRITVTAPSGATTVPVNVAEFTAIKARLANLFK